MLSGIDELISQALSSGLNVSGQLLWQIAWLTLIGGNLATQYTDRAGRSDRHKNISENKINPGTSPGTERSVWNGMWNEIMS